LRHQKQDSENLIVALDISALTAPQTSNSSTGETAGSAVTQTLGKNAFLQLLVQEMKNQDPLKPADNTEFIGQLAQFSSLEQMQNMNEGISSLKEGFTLAEARGLLGVPVTAVNSSTGSTVQGTVGQILINSSGVQLDINGTVVDVADVVSIGPGPSSSDTQLAPSTSDSTGQTATTSSGTTSTSDTTTTDTSGTTTTTSLDDATATDSSDSTSQTSTDLTASDTTDTSTVSTDDSIVSDFSSMTAVSA